MSKIKDWLNMFFPSSRCPSCGAEELYTGNSELIGGFWYCSKGCD